MTQREQVFKIMHSCIKKHQQLFCVTYLLSHIYTTPHSKSKIMVLHLFLSNAKLIGYSSKCELSQAALGIVTGLRANQRYFLSPVC